MALSTYPGKEYFQFPAFVVSRTLSKNVQDAEIDLKATTVGGERKVIVSETFWKNFSHSASHQQGLLLKLPQGLSISNLKTA